MSYHFSVQSLQRLETLDPKLKQLVQAVLGLSLIDFSIIQGFRTQAEQDAAFASGNSKLKWPQSKHNSFPSQAVDLLPYPTGWNKKEPFYYLAGLMMSTASFLHINLRWGGDWNQNGDLFDQSFLDLAHFELR